MSEHSHNVAWCAGFIDGEGTFLLITSEKDRLARCVIVVDQIDKGPLIKLHETLGGKLLPAQKFTSAGNPVYRWRVTNAPEVVRIGSELLPFLKLKQDRARLLVTYAALVLPRGARMTDEVLSKRTEIQNEWQRLYRRAD